MLSSFQPSLLKPLTLSLLLPVIIRGPGNQSSHAKTKTKKTTPPKLII